MRARTNVGSIFSAASSEWRASQVLAPAGPVAERAELQPDVVEVDLPEVEQRLLVVGGRLEPGMGEAAPARGVGLHLGHQLRAGAAGLHGLVLVLGIAQQVPDLKQEGRRAQLVGRRVVGRLRAQRQGHRGGRLVVPRVEQPPRFGQRGRGRPRPHGRGLLGGDPGGRSHQQQNDERRTEDRMNETSIPTGGTETRFPHLGFLARRRQPAWSEIPPSTRMTCPWMNRAAGVQRNATVWAWSRGAP